MLLRVDIFDNFLNAPMLLDEIEGFRWPNTTDPVGVIASKEDTHVDKLVHRKFETFKDGL